MRPVHSGQLERWLGRETCEHLSLSMRGWYAKPILLAGVPGAVYVGGDGEFYGTLKAGREASVEDRLRDAMVGFIRRYRRACRSFAVAGAGFPSLLDLIYEANQGKLFTAQFNKAQGTNTVSATFDYWYLGTVPVGAVSIIYGPVNGTVFTNATSGAIPIPQTPSNEALYFVNAWAMNIGAASSLLLTDRLFGFEKTINSTGSDVIYSGNVTRYQNTNPNTWDSAEGNFVYMVTTATGLPATAHTNTLVYTNENGTGSRTSPGGVGISSCTSYRIDLADTSVQWFYPLQSGDRGVLEISTVTCNALVATGSQNCILAHPIAWIPTYAIALLTKFEGWQSCFQMTRLHSDACLNLLHVARITGSNAASHGALTLVSG